MGRPRRHIFECTTCRVLMVSHRSRSLHRKKGHKVIMTKYMENQVGKNKAGWILGIKDEL